MPFVPMAVKQLSSKLLSIYGSITKLICAPLEIAFILGNTRSDGSLMSFVAKGDWYPLKTAPEGCGYFRHNRRK